MIRARFVKNATGFDEIILLGIAAIPRPGDIVLLTNQDGSVNYRVSWVNFSPQSPESDVTIGCDSMAEIKNDSAPSGIDGQELKERMKSVIDPHSRISEKSQNYSNVIMLAGYAGIFAIWGIVKDKISNFEAGCVAISIGLSLIIYISFELYAMILRSIYAAGAMNVVSADPTKYFKALEDFETKNRSSIAIMQKLWVFLLPPTILLGYGTALYLMYAIAFRILF